MLIKFLKVQYIGLAMRTEKYDVVLGSSEALNTTIRTAIKISERNTIIASYMHQLH
jgi:hypothetical protein